MNGDPASEILNIMNAQGKKSITPGMKIAKVLAVEETETEVKNIIIVVDDLQIDKDNIYISDYLLKEHKREIRTDIINDLIGKTNSVSTGGSLNHAHTINDLKINDAKIYFKDTLKADDLLAVMPLSDKQSYIILSRVVRIE